MPGTTEPAATGRRATRVWVTPSELVYVGPALGVREHSTAVPRLLIAIDEPFVIDWGGHTVRRATAVYVPPRTPHTVVTPATWWGVVYLEPGSHRDLEARGRAVVDLEPLAAPLAAGDVARVLDFLGPPGRPASPVSDLVQQALREGSPGGAGATATALGLSTSQLLRVFTAATGTSYRRFAMWARLLAATRLLSLGHSLTRVATDAGFASPSHLSDTVRTVFGFTATELLSTGVTVTLLEPPPADPRRDHHQPRNG